MNKHKHIWEYIKDAIVEYDGLYTTASFYYQKCECGKIRKMWGDAGVKSKFKGYVKEYPSWGKNLPSFKLLPFDCPYCGKKIK